jgi:hypothetical protein
MKLNFYIFIILLLMLLGLTGSHYPESNETDSTRQDSLAFNREIYERIKSDKSFLYEEDPVLKKSILSDVRIWLVERLSGFMRMTSGRWFDGLMLIFFTVLFLAAVFILFRSNPGGIFYSETKNLTVQPDTGVKEYYYGYETKLNEAVASGQWRNAVRFIYLLTLQNLAAQGIIYYKAEKSPEDYQKEMATHKHAEAFNKLVYVYTYVWYGNFSMDAEAFYALQKLVLITHIKETQP